MGKIIYTDRSRIVARQECAQMGYLNYEWEGTGLQRTEASLPLVTGIAIHAGFSRLLAGENVNVVIDDICRDYHEDLIKRGVWNEAKEIYGEQVMLVAGILRTWAYHRLPRLAEEYVIAEHPDGGRFLEKEFTYELAPGIKAMLRMDAVLRRRDNGALTIWDFKTLKYVSDDWYKQFDHNPQTYLYTAALADLMKEPVEGICYEGIVKGMRRTETAKQSKWHGKKIQASPYCYGYKFDVGGVVLYQTDYTAKKGYTKVAAFDEMTSTDWFEKVLLPEHQEKGLFNDLFCFTPVINPVPREVERWKRQVTYAEYLNQRYLEEIEEAKAKGDPDLARGLMEIYFPTNEGRCFKYGAENACQFTGICFDSLASEDPLSYGFERRIPHHDTETKENAA